MSKDRFMGARSVVLVLAILATSIGGCASPTPYRFYALMPVAGPETRTVEQVRSFTVGVTQVRMPEYLDRAQIATRIGPNEIRFDEFNRWAEPLKENFARVLAENLSLLLGADKVQVVQGAGVMPLDYQVWVEVIQFEAGPGGDVLLATKWSLYHQQSKEVLISKTFSLLEAAGASGYEALVFAGSRALAALSREIAEVIRAERKEMRFLDVRAPEQDGARPRFQP